MIKAICLRKFIWDYGSRGSESITLRRNGHRSRKLGAHSFKMFASMEQTKMEMAEALSSQNSPPKRPYLLNQLFKCPKLGLFLTGTTTGPNGIEPVPHCPS